MDLTKPTASNESFMFDTTHTTCNPSIVELALFSLFSERWHGIQAIISVSRIT